MKLTKLLFISIFITSLTLSACSKNDNLPEQDPLAEEKVQTHNQIGKQIHEMGKSSFDLLGQFALYYTETTDPKPTKEDLQKEFDTLFQNSEKLRKTVTEDFQIETEFTAKFENEYLPKLDALLNSAKENIEKPEDKDSFTKLQDLQKEYVTTHNAFIEYMNENSYY